MIIEVFTSYGKVKAEPMQLVDIQNVQPMADEESINNSDGEAQNTLATAASVQDPDESDEQ